MFTLLFFTTLPLFGLVFLGFTVAKFSLFNQNDAKILLKFIGLIILPTLGIKIIGEFRYELINWNLYFLYLVGQCFIYFCGFFLAKIIFKRGNAESIVIGMTSAFSNHLFFVYPIVLFEFDAKDVVPIETIIAADFITVGLSVCALDFFTNKDIKLKEICIKQLKNPALIGLFLGLTILLTDTVLPLSLKRFVDFICDAGVPCSLIAMGILLSYKTNNTQIKLSFLITFLKIFLFPIALYIIIFFFGEISHVSKTTMMVSAAPIGSMALIFASIYNVTSDAIVRSGILTYILSLFGIPLVGSLL